MLKKKISLPILLLSMVSLPVWADGTLRFETLNEIRPHTVYVGAGKVRMEAGDQSAGRISIYDSKKEEMIVLNPAERTYSTLDEETVKQQFQQMRALRDQMRQAMKTASPEERKMMEKSLEQMGMANPGEKSESAPEMRSEKGDEQKKVGDVPCTVYHTYLDTQQIGSACIATQQALDLSSDDFRALEGMYDFTRKVQNMVAMAQGASGATPINAVEDFKGMPIMVSSAENGEESRLVKISHKPLAKGLFEVPANYKKGR